MNPEVSNSPCGDDVVALRLLGDEDAAAAAVDYFDFGLAPKGAIVSAERFALFGYL